MRRKHRTSTKVVALVIDDRPSSLESRMKLLEANGFEVVGAKSVAEAVQEFETTLVDIVVTDINLDPNKPREKGGIEFARRVRESDSGIPIVGYSAVFSEGDLTSEELGVFDTCITKGSSRARELMEHLTNWREMALSYRMRRQARSSQPDLPRVDDQRPVRSPDRPDPLPAVEPQLARPCDHLDLLRVDDPQLWLYSVNTWLAYNIAQRFFGRQHYVWCTPDFDAESKPNYEATVPPSSCPKEIYRLLKEAVRRGDRHSDKIRSNAAGILRGAELHRAAGDITADQYEEIKQIIEHAETADFRPLLYVIRRDLVEDMLVKVPVGQKAAPLAPEFVIERLPWFLFQVLEIY
jgi:CheY-like chemotaxis protein